MSDEERMIELGKEAYWSRLRKYKQKGAHSLTASGRYMLREATSTVGQALENWTEEAKHKPGRRHTALAVLSRLDPYLVAMVAVRECIDSVALRKPFMTAAKDIGKALADEDRLRQIKEADPTLWKMVTKSIGMHTPKKKAELLRRAANRNALDVKPWLLMERVQAGIVMLDLVHQHSGIIEVKNIKDGKKTQTIILARDEFISWMEQADKANEEMRPYYLPTANPKDWVSVFEGGYSHPGLAAPLVKTRCDDHLQLLAEADLSKELRAVNALQQTEYVINDKVLAVFESLFKQGHSLAGLPGRELIPFPPKPDDIATNEVARKDWSRAASLVAKQNRKLQAKRVAIARTLSIAQEQTGPFSYVYMMDFRGRKYAKGQFLNPQGSDLSKGLLKFARAKRITHKNQAAWLAVHGANCYGNGVNLLRLQYRVDWVQENSDRIVRTADDPLADMWWASADSPWSFLAFCFEWREFQLLGYGFFSSLPVAMDGKNNGLQHYAMLTRSWELAKATSCVASEIPADIYSDIAALVTAKLDRVVRTRPGGDEGNWFLAEKLLALFDGHVPRKVCKVPVMALPYGVQLRGITDYLLDWYWEEGRHKQVNGFSSHGYAEMSYLAQTIWATMILDGPVSDALHLMDWLRDLAKTAAVNGVHLSWTTPSGFVVRQNYLDTSARVVKTALGDKIQRHRLSTPVDRINSRASATAFPANFIHSLDAAALTLTLNNCLDSGAFGDGKWSFSVVHDSYATHAADAELLAQSLRSTHAQMYSSDIVQRLADEVLSALPDGTSLDRPPATGRWDTRHLTEARYFFS